MPKYVERCVLYPPPWQDEPICKAGSDVSGLEKEDYICSTDYAETCPWMREYLKESGETK